MTTVEIDRTSLRLLVHALRSEADGKELRRDLRVGLKAAAEPALVAVRAAIITMPSKGLGKAPSIRAVIASRTKVHVLLGRKAGVSIRAHKSGMPRDFRNAPKRFNRAKPWRHPVFGDRDNWVSQVSRRPGWFDDTLVPFRPVFVRVADEALKNVARRISMKTRG